MIIGLLQIKIYLGRSGSLKDKRCIIRSLKDRLRNKFNVAVAETGLLEKWQVSEISIVTIGKDTRQINSALSNISGFVRSFNSVTILECNQEIL
jgi:hypothetical protein